MFGLKAIREKSKNYKYYFYFLPISVKIMIKTFLPEIICKQKKQKFGT